LEYKELIANIVECILSEDNKVAVSSLRTIGNVAGSTDEHTAFIAQKTKALETFNALLVNDNATEPNIKEICWTVSNIAANSIPNTQR
jgi:seryl-tRNA synthetase